MMRKRVFRIGAILVLCLTMLLGTATSAFAYYNEDEANEESAVIVEEPAEETSAETETATESDATAQEPQGQITPDGNMTLVDDLDYSSRAGLQFMTVTSKDGHVFYIVIDRTANSENVYFLNQVDAADLMALMNDEQKEEYLKEQEAKQQEQQTTVTPVQQETQAPAETEQPAQTETQKQPLNNNMVMLAVFGVIGIGVIAAFYFLKIKPKKTGSSIDEDREFYDDEEYENEDQEPAFAEDDEE